MSLRIYGASDDLVEVEGDIREEYTPTQDERDSVLVFSDGTVLTIQYTSEGVWRIAPLIIGKATYENTQAPSDDEDNYSDVATLSDVEIDWVLFANDWRLDRTRR